MDRGNLENKYKHLEAGKTYIINKTFFDFDNVQYKEGEKIVFIGSNFVPYEDGLSLFVVYRNEERQIRLQIRPEEQQVIAQSLEKLFVEMD